jgi:hypothetical protein
VFLLKRLGSSNGHLQDHIHFTNGKIQLKPIRHLVDANMPLNFLVAIGFGTHRKILANYRSGESAALAKKYL